MRGDEGRPSGLAATGLTRRSFESGHPMISDLGLHDVTKVTADGGVLSLNDGEAFSTTKLTFIDESKSSSRFSICVFRLTPAQLEDLAEQLKTAAAKIAAEFEERVRRASGCAAAAQRIEKVVQETRPVEACVAE